MSDRRIIRDAVPGDIPAIAAIYAVHVREGLASFELHPPSEDDMAQRIALIQKAGFPYLVAELEGQVAGYAYAASYRPRPAYHHTVENSVYMAPWAQRRGVGRALLGNLIGSYKPAAANFDYMVAQLSRLAFDKSDILHTVEGLFHDHMPANRHGLKSCRIYRRHDQEGFGATMPPDPMPSYDFRFHTMAALVAAHQLELSSP